MIGHGKLSGSEPIILHDAALPTTVLAFWSWALSDVVSNTARGLLAEFFAKRKLELLLRWTNPDRTLSLPLSPKVSPADQEDVAAALAAALRER